MKINYAIYVIVFLVSVGCNVNHSQPRPKLNIYIKQSRIDWLYEEYIITQNSIIIKQQDRSNLNMTKVVYPKKIDRKAYQRLVDFISENKIFELKDKYEISIMGGYVDWEILIENENNIKSIHVRNEKVSQIDGLFGEINKLIHKKNVKLARYYYN